MTLELFIVSDVNVRDPGNRNNNCTSVPEPQNGRKICHLGNNVISARGSVEIGTECKFLCNEGQSRIVNFDNLKANKKKR